MAPNSNFICAINVWYLEKSTLFPLGRTSMSLRNIPLLASVIVTGLFVPMNMNVLNLAVYCDGAYVGTFKLSDTRYPQTVSFSWPVTGKSFRFVIRGAYAGNKYQDVCISEIALN